MSWDNVQNAWQELAKEISVTQGLIAKHGDRGIMQPDNTAQSIRNPFSDQHGVKQPCSLWALKSVNTITISNKILMELLIEGMTDDEMEVSLKMKHQTVSACRRALVKKELVVPTGDTRPTRSGRKANVWELTTKGIEEARRVMGMN